MTGVFQSINTNTKCYICYCPTDSETAVSHPGCYAEGIAHGSCILEMGNRLEQAGSRVTCICTKTIDMDLLRANVRPPLRERFITALKAIRQDAFYGMIFAMFVGGQEESELHAAMRRGQYEVSALSPSTQASLIIQRISTFSAIIMLERKLTAGLPLIVRIATGIFSILAAIFIGTGLMLLGINSVTTRGFVGEIIPAVVRKVEMAITGVIMGVLIGFCKRNYIDNR